MQNPKAAIPVLSLLLLCSLLLAPAAARAHPTEEHFLPLFVALGAAGTAVKSTCIYTGMEGAALSMDAYEFRQAA